MMKTDQFKLDFDINKQRKLTTMSVYDADGSKLVFNARKFGRFLGIGPFSYFELRNANYGPEGMGFEASTLGELVPLVCSAHENKGKKEADRVTRAFRNLLAGKTLALIGKEGILVDDNPDLELVRRLYRKNPQYYETTLKNRLGKKQEGKVVYSDDELVRFVPRGFLLGHQSSRDFANSYGLVALVRNPDRTDMLGRICEKHYNEAWFGLLDRADPPQLRSVGIGALGLWFNFLGVGGDCPGRDIWNTYGIKRSAEDTHVER